jgi:hypothetical protein
VTDARRLFAASFLMLFVELVLIRWLGAHIVHLSFFSNFVLLGAFLGIGVGFIYRGGADWFRWSPVLLAFVLAFARLPRDDREPGQRGDLLWTVARDRSSGLGDASRGLPCRDEHDGGDRTRRRASFWEVQPA